MTHPVAAHRLPLRVTYLSPAHGRVWRQCRHRGTLLTQATLALGALLAATGIRDARAMPQGPVLDSGTLVISRDGQVVGREEFTVRRGNSSGPDGYTITSAVYYPPSSPRVTFSPVVELGPDSLPVQVQFDIYGDGQSRVYARFGPRRITLRAVRPSGESARELPSTGREIVADDSVFALYAVPPARGARQARTLRNSLNIQARLQAGMGQTVRTIRIILITVKAPSR